MISWTQQRQGGAVPRPRTGETPIRHVRVDDQLWSQIGEIAREQDRTASAVAIDALKRYVAWHKRQGKRADMTDSEQGKSAEQIPSDT